MLACIGTQESTIYVKKRNDCKMMMNMAQVPKQDHFHRSSHDVSVIANHGWRLKELSFPQLNSTLFDARPSLRYKTQGFLCLFFTIQRPCSGSNKEKHIFRSYDFTLLGKIGDNCCIVHENCNEMERVNNNLLRISIEIMTPALLVLPLSEDPMTCVRHANPGKH